MRHSSPTGTKRSLSCAAWAGVAALALLAYGIGLHAERVNTVRVWSAPVGITILHTNDMHGQVLPHRGGDRESGFVALARRIRQERDQARRQGRAVLLLDAGDIFQGTPEGNLTDGQVVVAWMNHLGYDAMTVGNHEFDFGREIPARLAQQAKFPFLGINIIDEGTGRPVPWLGLRDRVLDGGVLVRTLEVSGRRLRVGVIGVTTDEMKKYTVAGVTDGLAFGDAGDAVAAVLDGGGLPPLDVVVLLSHCGVEVDRVLAERFAGRVDVIIGGHSHTLLPAGERVGPVLVAQAGSKARGLGRIDLEVQPPDSRQPDARPRVDSHAAVLDPGDDIQAVLAPYVAQVEVQANRPVGMLTAPLYRVQGFASSALGNLQTDLMRELTGAEVAFQNKPGIRADLEAGELTWRDLYQVSPFGNTVVTMHLKGADIRELLEGMLGPSATLLEVSGLEVVVDLDAPLGKRVVEVTVDGAPLDLAREYVVATNNFLQGGKDGHLAFARGTHGYDTGVTMQEMVLRFFAKNSPYRPGPTEARLRIR